MSNSGSLLDYVELWARFKPGASALADDHVRLTWGQLDRQSTKLAAWFRQQGVRPGDRIGCFLPDCALWGVIIVAALKCGAIVVSINVRHGTYDIHAIVDDVRCAAYASTTSLFRRLLKNPDQAPGSNQASDAVSLFVQGPERFVATPLEAALAEDIPFVPVQRSPGDVAIICFTSGTTGVPKGVMLTDGGIVNMATGMIQASGWTHGERILTLSSMGFAGGIASMFMPFLVSGGSIYFPPDLKPATALRIIVNERITVVNGVPTLWDAMSRLPDFNNFDMSCLRTGIIGGAPIPPELIDLYIQRGVGMRQCYGQSENGGLVSTLAPDSLARKYYTAGKALLNMEIRVVNERFENCPVGATGEIVMRGRSMMKGYWNKPKETADAFRDGWYLSGDLGRIDADGDLQLVDRKKNMLISGGVNVYPAEVEKALKTLAGVIEAVVFGRPDRQWGQVVIAALWSDGSNDQAIPRLAKELLGDFKTPKEFWFARIELPRTHSDKIARREIAELCARLATQKAHFHEFAVVNR
jgi:fatty-acyl-CoA synthase